MRVWPEQRVYCTETSNVVRELVSSASAPIGIVSMMEFFRGYGWAQIECQSQWSDIRDGPCWSHKSEVVNSGGVVNCAW